ncbi:MAG: peptidylprolyl isomerase [Desulfuromonas sp.]|nr:MAG: peptidylprolyl isomerase [Desulfuromonas sp.]
MQRARQGDRVTVHYIGTLDNGKIFDQRDADEPLQLTLGAGEVFPELEAQIIGMGVGEVKNIILTPEQAFGVRKDENLIRVKRELFPADAELRIAQKLAIEIGGGAQRVMRVRSFDEHEVLLDGNHDLAGCDLTFALQLIGIEES